jgi:hypothetical protein
MIPLYLCPLANDKFYATFFEALMFGIIYALPHTLSQYRTVKLRLLDENLLKCFKENNSAAV